MSCLWKDRSRKDGLCVQCILCKKQYCKNNSKQRKQIRKKNIKNKKQYDKQYRKDNIDHKTAYEKQYNTDNAPQIAKRRKQYHKNNALFETHSKKLETFEEIRQCPKNQKLLEVKCAYCGKWMLPTNLQTQARIEAFNGSITKENRFYCSENCKRSCPIYRQRKYPKGFKKATSREVVPLLRQLFFKRDNYTCQKCGATSEIAQLHVHHEKSYTLNKIMANDPDNCITLCKECHKWIHSKEGCNYNDLKCFTK